MYLVLDPKIEVTEINNLKFVKQLIVCKIGFDRITDIKNQVLLRIKLAKENNVYKIVYNTNLSWQ